MAAKSAAKPKGNPFGKKDDPKMKGKKAPVKGKKC